MRGGAWLTREADAPLRGGAWLTRETDAPLGGGAKECPGSRERQMLLWEVEQRNALAHERAARCTFGRWSKGTPWLTSYLILYLELNVAMGSGVEQSDHDEGQVDPQVIAEHDSKRVLLASRVGNLE